MSGMDSVKLCHRRRLHIGSSAVPNVGLGVSKAMEIGVWTLWAAVLGQMLDVESEQLWH